MKPTVVSADVLFEDHRGTLHWEWVAGLGASERRFDEVAIREARSGADLVGYLNYIHPYRLQILGVREVAYLTNATPEDCARRIARIVTLEPPVLVLADGQAAPPALLSMCERAQLPMFSTRESSAFVIDVMIATCRLTIFSLIFAASICFLAFATPGSMPMTPPMPPIFWIWRS